MNDIDYKALKILMGNARATWAEIGGELGMTGPAAADRIRKLEEKGYIKGYAALVDPESVGCGFTAFVSVILDRPPEYRAAFLEKVAELQEIQECHHVAGDYDYLLKVRCNTTRHFDHVVSTELRGLPGVVRIRTTVVLDTEKETPIVPMFSQSTESKKRV
jgi:Lrp/AsnC family leucine-responsive transcriptional regulator